MRLPLVALVALSAVLAATAGGAAPASVGAPAAPAAHTKPAAAPTRASICRPTSAKRCSPAGCEDAGEGLHAEQFEVDVGAATLGACLYTDCYVGKARLVRERGTPWIVTAFGEVHSERPEGSVPPKGSDPFPLLVTVDLRTGHFSATWSITPAGQQVDFGTCQLRR
jgi:hypothetical protein